MHGCNMKLPACRQYLQSARESRNIVLWLSFFVTLSCASNIAAFVLSVVLTLTRTRGDSMFHP